MPRKYTKLEILSEEVMRRKAAGETNRQIAEIYGLTLEQIKELVKRQNRKARLIAQGYVPRPKGRPRKNPSDEETKRKNELAELRMQVELLKNFLSEAGRR
jgi:transposase